MSSAHALAEEAAPLPLAAGRPLPHRKTLRAWMAPLSERTTATALVLLSIDYGLFLALTAGTVLLGPVWLKLLCGLAAGFVIGRLFVIGHDGCHQSLTPHRRLNRVLGRIAFLPSLTAYSLWDMGHNVVHHGFTNLKGVDFVWAPLTQDEYRRLSPVRRAFERLYRSGWGPGAYYMVEIWWKKMMFPGREAPGGTARPAFTRDCLLVTGFAALWCAALAAGALAASQPLGAVLLAGFVVPLLFWFHLMGFVIYGHHTHVRVRWHDDRTAWQRAQPFVSTTVHLTFPLKIGALIHNVMEHTAHHVDMGIPLYRLQEAQKVLEHLLPGRIIVQRFSWKWYFDTARACKLYDFTRQCWTDFAGRATGMPRARPTGA
ncbi:fatty acid desaturase [Xylophilus sp.]|uniref:fatty acid desaturase n=1 Tax=Xylophilus sp. TaxID=2653893 RepID=UPI0013B6CE5E|nr:fatty acid desaturase [Xylophilus sp.]KAF1048234.1 MAG: Delta(12)-fatty-acid desaturase [Xylophilus sp.]